MSDIVWETLSGDRQSRCLETIHVVAHWGDRRFSNIDFGQTHKEKPEADRISSLEEWIFSNCWEDGATHRFMIWLMVCCWEMLVIYYYTHICKGNTIFFWGGGG